jgi:hypothetical protein
MVNCLQHRDYIDRREMGVLSQDRGEMGRMLAECGVQNPSPQHSTCPWAEHLTSWDILPPILFFFFLAASILSFCFFNLRRNCQT